MRINLIKKEYPLLGEVFYRGVLPNGQVVLLLPKPNFQGVYGSLRVALGAMDRTYKIVDRVVHIPFGLAHFLEHKLFEKEESKDMVSLFSSNGADVNAYTSLTHTAYFFSGTQHLLENLKLLEELAGQPYFTEESIAREKDIIAQEIKMYLDDPNCCLYSGVLAQLYPGTPLAIDIAGTFESIQEITTTCLYDHHRQFYRPNQMTLMIVGRFNVEEVWEALCQQKVFGNIDECINIERLSWTTLPVVPMGRREMEVALPKLGIGFRGQVGLQGMSSYRYRLILTLFFNLLCGWTSEWHQSLHQTGRIDSLLSIQVEVQEKFQHVVLTVDTKEPLAVAHLLTKVLEDLEGNRDISEEHFLIQKRDMYGNFLHQLDSLAWLTEQFLQDYSEQENLFDLPEILEKLSFDTVLTIGKIFLETCSKTEYMIFPKISR